VPRATLGALPTLLAVLLAAAPGGARLSFEPPLFPAADPQAAARAELGRHLFYERRLSVNGLSSCAGCHRQELAFTDGHPRAEGTTGETHPRSAMSLANVGSNRSLGWDDPKLTRLEDQALVPLLNRHPIELGLSGHEIEVLLKLGRDPLYRRLFAAAFAAEPQPLTFANLTRALAAFERTLVSADAPFDRWLHRDQPLPPAARRGMALFFSRRLGCAGCHHGPDFDSGGEYLNTGLYDVDGRGAYPKGGEGLYRHTGRPRDMGRFRAPTLRNIAVTAPYMHDGSVATLGEAIDLYARGGRTASRRKDARLRGFTLSPGDKSELLAFLEALTDRGFLVDPRFASPFGGR
jgi:cytochrome c peroxidase